MVIGTPMFLLNEYLSNVDVAQRKALAADVERPPACSLTDGPCCSFIKKS
jgi:hypothetical protein